jgi:uncharacterized SAM-binding protein YcdF (DUF218 family)
MTTTIVIQARRRHVLPALPASAARVIALVTAACIVFGAGIAAATRLGGSVAQPTQSQQPSITSPALR